MSISEHILEKLRANDASMVDLSISNGALGDEGAKILAKAIERNSVLQSVELGNSHIGAEGAKALSKVLMQDSCKIKILYLRGNKIGDAGSKALSEALMKNNCLEHLYLGGNQIGLDGVKAFAAAFTKNSVLQTIYLRNNKVGDEGAQILADALSKNFGLRVLNVANAHLTEEGCRTLLKLLDVNSTLQSIVFEHNGVEDEEIVKSFEEKFKYNASLPVVTSNNIARKILSHCEEHIEQEKNKDSLLKIEDLAQKFSLSRSEQYHWSGTGSQGNAILCVGFLSRMIFGRYDNQDVANQVAQTLCQLYPQLIARAKEDLANPQIAKINQEVLQAAAKIVS